MKQQTQTCTFQEEVEKTRKKYKGYGLSLDITCTQPRKIHENAYNGGRCSRKRD